MPVPVAAKVGIVAASVAVAAAIAIYEIPEVRRAAEELRRRIAIALHSLGDTVGPDGQPEQPRFNRPEDAEGFYQSQDLDADEETRRKQREELMYWNLRREEEQRKEQQEQQQRQHRPPQGFTFDDFLQPDRAGDSGSFVFNTGSNTRDAETSNVLRRRGNIEGVQGLRAGMLANPFGDEHAIELEDRTTHLVRHTNEEGLSDIYNATPRILSPPQPFPAQPVPVPAATTSEVLFDFGSHVPSDDGNQEQQQKGTSTPTSRSATLDRELAEDEYMTAGQDRDDDDEADERGDAYASIQAWARGSSAANATAGFYSPLPSTPRAPVSEPELISEGQLTPTDSASVAGSGVDVAHEMGVEEVGAEFPIRGEHNDFDVMSETDGGLHTPRSWSEVGSVVSESESVARA
ncbi:hypothetical protein C8A05DRAFT_40323 [Staphylotrichum tortipilum]|uniref:Uncharacterized protein n=1 Tax=Staphylotrichum tortipilum TaxID=2831512 RepID=A0AAN6RX87_9PEZI|nr:hypothetical protein C8A05DRAFT_40323 [Staphylotrichum longicolle]